jgi:hypothetical protein
MFFMCDNTFISDLPSKDAIKLANAIYQTYMLEDDPSLSLSVIRLCEVFALTYSKETYLYFLKLFDELNEPVALKDFSYENRVYEWLVAEFCTFDSEWKFEDKHIQITVNEIYLSAMQSLMEEPFIEFKD